MILRLLILLWHENIFFHIFEKSILIKFRTWDRNGFYFFIGHHKWFKLELQYLLGVEFLKVVYDPKMIDFVFFCIYSISFRCWMVWVVQACGISCYYNWFGCTRWWSCALFCRFRRQNLIWKLKTSIWCQYWLNLRLSGIYVFNKIKLELIFSLHFCLWCLFPWLRNI